MRRLGSVLASMALVVAACTGGSDGKSQDPTEPSLPLPDKAPSARGPAVGPALEPKVLLAASDELEEQAGDLNTAQVQRRSDAFISGDTVVGYSVDDISGYDLNSGEQLWTADLDLGSGTVCFVSQPDRAVKTFTVVFGEGGFCPQLATIRVSDGKIVSESEKLSDINEFEGELAGGTVNELFTVNGKDYLVDMHGVVWVMAKGEPEEITRLETSSYSDLNPTPDGKTLIGTRLSDAGRCRVDAYELPSFTHLWTQENSSLFPDVRKDCLISSAPGDPAWLMHQGTDRYYMAQVDPATGKVVGRSEATNDSGGKAAEGEFDLASAANQFDRGLGLPGGDMVFSQVRGLTRFSLETGKVAWDLDLSQLELESDEDFPMTTVLPQGITADGYVVASVSNDTGVEIVAINAKNGKLAARWAVPQEYRNGFQVQPGLTLFGGGIVLTRNFETWERAFADYLDVEEPTGDRFDIGVFTFPEPDNSGSAAVPVAGPVDTMASALGGITAPEAAPGERRSVGAFSTGSVVVGRSGNTLTGLEPSSGDEQWTLQVDPDPAARICTTPEGAEDLESFTIAYRDGADGSRCSSLLHIDASDGKVLERLAVPAAAREIYHVRVHDGVEYLVAADAKVYRLVDGALVEHASLARLPYTFEQTPQDPSLLISVTSLKDGREWAIDGYRLPSFDRVWSTTASKVFSKVDPRHQVTAWRGNGLWVSTAFGDSSTPEGKVSDSLALLDPATGKVVQRTGRVKRDYLADDLAQFSLTSAYSAAYVTAGFDNGDVVLPQRSGVMRYSLADKKPRWSVDTSSIRESMERDRTGTYVAETFDVIDGGKTVLVIMSNNVSVEAMTLDSQSGKITGRWNIPEEFRNGLQTSPGAVPFDGGVALTHNEFSWDSAFAQSGREVPPGQRYDVGLFRLSKPKGD